MDRLRLSERTSNSGHRTVFNGFPLRSRGDSKFANFPSGPQLF